MESGEYENFGVDFVAESAEAAELGIMARFGPPYVVRWERGPECVRGFFEQVVGYSVKHTSVFSWREIEVYDGNGVPSL